MLVLPPNLDVTLRDPTVLVTTKISGDTGSGWHYVGVVGVPSASDLAAKCRKIIAGFRATAGRTNTPAYDLLTHLRLMREFYFFQGKHRRGEGAGAADRDPELLIANCSFEAIA